MIEIPAPLPRDADRTMMPMPFEPEIANAPDTFAPATFSTIIERSIPSALPPQIVHGEPATLIDERSGATDGAAHSFAESSLFNTRATATKAERSTTVTISPLCSREVSGGGVPIALNDGGAMASDTQTAVRSIAGRSHGIAVRGLPAIAAQDPAIPRQLGSSLAPALPRTLPSTPIARPMPPPIKRLAPTQRTLSPIHVAIAAIENGFAIAARVDRSSPDCGDRLAREAEVMADELGIDIAAVTVNGRNATARNQRKR